MAYGTGEYGGGGFGTSSTDTGGGDTGGTTSTMSLTWETAADWDAAQSESGVHHEQPAGTDWSAASVLEKGYPTYDQNGSALEGYWPMDDASGPMVDVSGNGNDFALNGASTGAIGTLGTTAMDVPLSSSADPVATGVNGNDTEFSACLWFKWSQADNWSGILECASADTEGWRIVFPGSERHILVNIGNGGWSNVVTTSTLSTDTWYFVVLYDEQPGTGAIHLFDSNGELTNSPWTWDTNNRTATAPVPLRGQDFGRIESEYDELRIWSRKITPTEVTDLYEAVM